VEAGTFGIVAADRGGILNDHFEQLFIDKAPKGPIVSDTRTAVFAMGTGLSADLIVKSGKQSMVLPTELGKWQIPLVGVGHENYRYEKELFDAVGGVRTPKFEDLASRRGLEMTYKFVWEKMNLRKLGIGKLDGPAIADLSRKGDPVAVEAVTLQHLYLVREAKLAATALGCDSILFALDDAVNDNYIYQQKTDRFKKEFYDFLRPEWMKSIRLYAQVKKENFILMGTAYVATNLAIANK
jgi:glucokinase